MLKKIYNKLFQRKRTYIINNPGRGYMILKLK